uniref:Uncharacterized protein n=1 Tax=Dunaliella tertiolecta TaxID=3047 RepID=A0A7S3VPX3_DUNTE|mmetsp:Transcript_13652/g.36924  ORF Transcript_13652/g.36924 Transcript_13652/m.36924 type:complete len:488 (+) Transcript_13652:202-1665(+)
MSFSGIGNNTEASKSKDRPKHHKDRKPVAVHVNGGEAQEDASRAFFHSVKADAESEAWNHQQWSPLGLAPSKATSHTAASGRSGSPRPRHLYSPLASPPSPNLTPPSARRPNSASPLSPARNHHHNHRYQLSTSSSPHAPTPSSHAVYLTPRMAAASSHISPLHLHGHPLAFPHPESSPYHSIDRPHSPSSTSSAHHHSVSAHGLHTIPSTLEALHAVGGGGAGEVMNDGRPQLSIPRPASTEPSLHTMPHPRSPLYSPTAATTAQRPGALIASVLRAQPSEDHADPESSKEFTELLNSAIKRASSPGPTKSEKTAPKYTMNSMREPEIGSQPGKYVDPGGPWRPIVPKETDAQREQLDPPLKGGPYDRVLAVPAHVLAQSFFHPDRPSAQVRVRELQKELKAARADKKLQHDRAALYEVELESTRSRLKAALHENALARAHIAALQEQLAVSRGRAPSPTRASHSPPSKLKARPRSAVLPRRAHFP